MRRARASYILAAERQAHTRVVESSNWGATWTMHMPVHPRVPRVDQAVHRRANRKCSTLRSLAAIDNVPRRITIQTENGLDTRPREFSSRLIGRLWSFVRGNCNGQVDRRRCVARALNCFQLTEYDPWDGEEGRETCLAKFNKLFISLLEGNCRIFLYTKENLIKEFIRKFLDRIRN